MEESHDLPDPGMFYQPIPDGYIYDAKGNKLFKDFGDVMAGIAGDLAVLSIKEHLEEGGRWGFASGEVEWDKKGNEYDRKTGRLLRTFDEIQQEG